MAPDDSKPIRTDIPQRLDRLPWSRFHLLLVIALGITWILDGLEVTIVGSIGPVLQSASTLHLSNTQVGEAASFYVIGAVIGALISGWITDRYGRRFVFYVTLIMYLAGVLLSSMAWDFASFALFRMVTGLGIGGEYAAVNSAIDELIPAKYRGRVDLIVNGSFWVGAAAGAGASVIILNPDILPANIGWRLGFAVGGVLGLCILFLRRWVPESPRWLITHCREEEAKKTTKEIEDHVTHHSRQSLPPPEGSLQVRPRKVFGLGLVFRSMLVEHRVRSLLVITLMVAQAFLYNSVFFTYGLVLTHYYHLPGTQVGTYLLPLTISNFAGPLLLGHFFDTIGRRKMITGTFAVSGVLLLGVAWFFGAGQLTAITQTGAWIAIFFFASAAASSAYLTASEIFPLETRALAIACFYAVGTLLGGSFAPTLFGWLIEQGSPWYLSGGYVFAAVLLLLAAVAEAFLGVDAEGKSLESIASPISST
jgi:MFS family permease